jgi:hypothetical protein
MACYEVERVHFDFLSVPQVGVACLPFDRLGIGGGSEPTAGSW